MKSKVKKLEGTARQFDVEMPKSAVDERYKEVFADIQKSATLPGFRKGKVPLDIIQKKYVDDADSELKRRLIPEAYQSALKEHDVTPVGYPEVWDVNVSEKGLTFKAKVDVYPKVDLGRYTALEVNISKISVTDKEIDEVIERFRNMQADFTDIEGSLKKGDFAIANVETFADGKAISKERENMWIEVSKEASLLGMGEKLEGAKKGDNKEIKVTLPEKYPDEKYAGKEALFKVEIKETKQKKLPELNDEFAAKIGSTTMPDAREEVKKQLLERKEADLKISMKNQIMEQLLKKHKFDLPFSMVHRQLKVLSERAEQELKSKGVDEKVIEEHKEKLKKSLKMEAENKVKLYFILDKIAGIEKISVSVEDVDNWIKVLAGSYQKPFEEVKKYYQEHDLLGGLQEQLREEKTLDFLLEKAETVSKK